MKLVLLVWLIYLCVQFAQTEKDKKTEDSTISNICNKTNFDDYTKTPNVKVTIKYLDDLKENCKKIGWNKTCDFEAQPYLSGTDTKHGDYIGFHVKIDNTTACWATALIVSIIEGPSDETPPIQIKEVGEYDPFKFAYRKNMHYRFDIRGIPNGKTLSQEWNNAIITDVCGKVILNEIREKLANTTKKGTNELCKLNITYVEGITKNLCSMTKKERGTKTFEVDENCNLMVKTKLSDEKTSNRYQVTMITVGAVSGSIICACFISFMLYKRKQRNRLPYNVWNDEYDAEVNNNERPSSVMIIHRPGCDYLDKLVSQLSSFLMSYNLDVKVTFDGDDLSADGGIATYLHRNIATCDHILIFITEKSGKNPLLKHRPYEFSLKLMEGLAIHETPARARFIPVYITKFKQTVAIFPPFLKATSGYGYCIPQKNDQLIQKLLKIKRQSKKSDDRHVKDKLFRCEMKETIQRLLSPKHECCSKEHCKKGTKHGSHTNLSSIWATTYTTESLDDENMTIYQEEEENEMKELQFHKTLNFVQNLTVENFNVFHPQES